MNTATAQCRSSLKAGISRLLPGRHMLTVIGLLLVLMRACVMPVHAEEAVGDSELFSRLSATDRRAAFAAAAELGRRENVPALEFISGHRDRELLYKYLDGFKRGVNSRDGKRTILPPAIERLLAQNYNAPEISRAIQALAASRSYSGRELFDLKLQEVLKHANERNTRYIDALMMTDQAAIGETLDILPRLGDFQQRRLLFLLGSKGYEPASEAIAAYLIDEQGKPKYSMGSLYSGLVNIGTGKSLDLLVRHLAKFPRAGATDRDYNEVVNLFLSLVQPGKDVPLDGALLDRVTPYRDASDKVLAMYLQIVREQGLKAAAAGLYRYLPNQAQQRNVFDTLMSFDDRNVWVSTRSELDALEKAGKVEANLYRSMDAELRRRLDDPEKYFADKRDAELNNRMHREKSEYEIALRNLRREKDTLEAAQFMEQYRNLLATMTGLAARYELAPHVVQIRSDIVGSYIELGSYARFRSANPQLAMQYYQSALDYTEKAENNFSAFIYLLIADTWRFDLGDHDKALNFYRLALDEAKLANEHPPAQIAPAFAFIEHWLPHEIGYLDNGRVFSGQIGRAAIRECGPGAVLLLALVTPSEEAAGWLLGYGLPGADLGKGVPDNRMARDTIAATARSHILLLYVLQNLPFLGDDALVAQVLDDRDPARYLGSCLLGYQLQLYASLQDRLAERGSDESDSGVRGAIAERFTASRRLATQLQSHDTIGISYGADDRLSSPEKTWERFIEALRAGDRDGVRSCLSGGMQDKWRQLLVSLDASQLAEMAEGMSALTGGMIVDEETRVYHTTRKGRSGEIWFTRVGSEWLIGEM